MLSMKGAVHKKILENYLVPFGKALNTIPSFLYGKLFKDLGLYPST